MKTLKRTIAVLLTLILVSSSFVCFAADSEKQYHKYDKYLLLGDSQASGFVDYGYKMTEFTYVEDSYAAYLAKDLGAELKPMACPGFRTIELRLMLDDEYVTDDPYLFEAVPHHSAEEILAKKDEMRQAVTDADLITIAIGGNDWGAYLGWVMTDFLEDHPLPEDFKNALREFLLKANIVEDNIIKVIIELAQTFNAMDDFLAVMPKAIEYAFSTFNENWTELVEIIYEMNPDVTLVAVGLFNTTLSTPEGEPENVATPDPLAVEVEQMIIDYGNKPMTDNQEKYGYIYVDTNGTIVETAHPTPAGHRHIANRILEELPDARFPYTDVPVMSAEYKAVEYMYLNDLMKGTDATTFNGDAKITKAEFSEVLNKITGDYAVSDSTKEVTKLELSTAVYTLSGKTGITDMFSHVISVIKMIFNGEAFKTVSRSEAALRIYNAVK